MGILGKIFTIAVIAATLFIIACFSFIFFGSPDAVFRAVLDWFSHLLGG